MDTVEVPLGHVCLEARACASRRGAALPYNAHDFEFANSFSSSACGSNIDLVVTKSMRLTRPKVTEISSSSPQLILSSVQGAIIYSSPNIYHLQVP